MKDIKHIITEVEKIIDPVYLVGGPVRDMIMERECHDFDFTTPIEPDEIERLVKKAGKRAYTVGKKFGTIGFTIDGEMIEVTTFREETYEAGNRKPNVKFVKNITHDLSRRDFTMNAIAYRNGKFIDPFDGRKDIENKIIRAVGTASHRFKEDPLRMLRACRFVSQLIFQIEDKTFEAIEKKAHKILEVSKERWMSEMDKLLMSNNTRSGLVDLWHSNLMKYMMPELNLQLDYNQNSKYHEFNLDIHTMMVVENCPKDLNLRWAALLHDIAKPFCRTDKLIIPTLQETLKDMPDGGTIKSKMKSNYIKHDLIGAEFVDKYAGYFKWSNERHKAVRELVLNHLMVDCPLREYDNIGKVAK